MSSYIVSRIGTTGESGVMRGVFARDPELAKSCNRKAFCLGRSARTAGKKLSDCPYIFTTLTKAWKRGFRSLGRRAA
jgi:hypothetical protein